MVEGMAASRRRLIPVVLVAVVLGTGLMFVVMRFCVGSSAGRAEFRKDVRYRPSFVKESSGLSAILENLTPWPEDISLQELSGHWKDIGARYAATAAATLKEKGDQLPVRERMRLLIAQVMFLNAGGDADAAYKLLCDMRSDVEKSDELSRDVLFSIIFLQGVTSLRIGENENCVMCRGSSSCILPLARDAVHKFTKGSRQAVVHFEEYLSVFPNSYDAKWLLNLAYMTLGEYPQGVNPRHRLNLDAFKKSEFDLGRFPDISREVGVDRFGQAGGACMDDFDNDGLLDLVLTCWDATESMTYYKNRGDGTFENQTESAYLSNQLGGLYCCQVDFNNDGNLDLFVSRGAWLPFPVRPSLLKNLGGARFEDVTDKAGMSTGLNSNSAAWADYDNDGWADLFIPGEQQASRLYRNRGDETFEEVAIAAGIDTSTLRWCKGATWTDFDNDGFPDLFLNFIGTSGRLYHNKQDGTFEDVSRAMGIIGPMAGFSCWSWDFDNDGWLDIFASSYDRSVGGVIDGLIGRPNQHEASHLFRNQGGQRFAEVSGEAGLDMALAPMGSNFADFDNDGYLDFYLATGDPSLSTLIPNRMFKNVGGARFSEITASSGTGHLQKGHAVACGDWDRDGDVDLFVQTGGATFGDQYHSVLFDNPGQGNQALFIRLHGTKSNRAAIGARIKAVVDDGKDTTVRAVVSSGSSFGANTFEQTIGTGRANRVKRLEVHWPTSGIDQVFEDLASGQLVEITEGSSTPRLSPLRRIRSGQ